MAFVPIPKDLTRVKSKILFNLTRRQLVFFSLGALAGVPLFLVTKDIIGVSAASLLMIAVMLPFFLLAMYEKHGQPAEVILRQIVQAKWIRPKQRPYKTSNFYTAVDRDIRMRNEVNRIVQRKEKAR